MRVFQTKTKSDRMVRTQQHFGPECDINVMVAKYKKTGMLGGSNPQNPPQYVDTTVYSQKSYEDAFNEVKQIQDTFGQLPAALRARFNHNPAFLLGFLSDKKNHAEGVRLGLLKPDQKTTKKEAEKQKSTHDSLDVMGTTDTFSKKEEKSQSKKKIRRIVTEEEIDA